LKLILCTQVEEKSGTGVAFDFGGANQSSSTAFRRRSKIGSIYASTRSSIRMKMNRSSSQARAANARLAVHFAGADGGGGGGKMGNAEGGGGEHA
jgi:hypothetical protein